MRKSAIADPCVHLRSTTITAAEDGDVGDHAAPDQVKGARETLEQVFAGLLGWDMNRSPSSTGVLMGVVRDPRGDGIWVASTAFRSAHASWDNAKRIRPRCARTEWRSGDGRSDLATRKSVARGYREKANLKV